jgi:hypothetical protein
MKLQADETTDVAGLAVMLAAGRSVNNKAIEGEQLFCKLLTTRLAREDIFSLVDSYLILHHQCRYQRYLN